MELLCTIQKYEWGKLGSNSKVAELCKSANPDFEIDNGTPYAELWMGTHPNGPTIIKETGETLGSFVARNPQVLGENVLNVFGGDLPFLFKVLSVNKALSVQAHPSKAHAEKLHKERPDIYKDPNHKPELAIALTPFKALCGFRPVNEIKAFLNDLPELRSLIGEEKVELLMISNAPEAYVALKSCFNALMTSSEDRIKKSLRDLIARLSQSVDLQQKLLGQLVMQLFAQFPDDVGCFSVYFLNIIDLQPLEALYLGPNEPHAYISGDCIECMACSDNVVRAGLTPKFKDVETLCSMLNYKGEPAEKKKLRCVQEDKFNVLYQPPVSDFAVSKIEAPQGVDELNLKPRSSGSILISISGCGQVGKTDLKPGSVLFIPANDVVTIKDIKGHLLLFQAMANL